MTGWRGRPVLVTGADGFIGSHLVEALVKTGAEVTALAQYNSFDSHGWLDDLTPDVRGSARLVRGDIRDGDHMRQLARGRNVVFHLAALISIPYSYDSPASYVQTNLQGTVNVLQAALQAGAKVIHTSTSEVYGTATTLPIDEDHRLCAHSPYAASKIAADAMAESFHRAFGLGVVTLRPFNAYGPRQSERAFIAAVIRQALDPACREIRLGDLTPKRDFTFVDDTVRAFLAVAELDDGHLGQTFNAGSGHMMSVGDVVEKVQALTGTRKPVVRDAERVRPAASEVMALQADSSRLQAATGWRPAVTLEEGLRRTLEWWSRRLDRTRVMVRPGAGYMT